VPDLAHCEPSAAMTSTLSQAMRETPLAAVSKTTLCLVVLEYLWWHVGNGKTKSVKKTHDVALIPHDLGC
jgi:hypothetical protein